MGKKKHFFVKNPNANGNNHSYDSNRQYFMGMPMTKPAEPPMDPEKKIALQKLMVGHFIEKVPDGCTKKVVYIMQGDGIYEQRINKLGRFTTKIAKVDIPGLESNLNEGWEINVPKIPIELLGTTVSFFRRIYKEHSSEVFVQFYWDTERNEYIIHCPKQTVSGASVRYENDELFSDANKILVFEIHSHGGMSAFFSSTDDRDEKADRFFGVVGNINNFFPEIKLRISVGGSKMEVKVEDLFDLDEEMYHSETYPNDWVKRIEKAEVRIVKGGNRRFRQSSVFDDSGMEDIIAQLESQEHLYSQYECPKDEPNVEDGIYVQEGDDLWYVVGDKRYLVQTEEDTKPEQKPAESREESKPADSNNNYDPYDWRKARF